MEKINRKLTGDEVIHSALVVFGTILLLYIWMVPLAQSMGYFMQPMSMLPLFAYLTVGTIAWDRIIHGVILKKYS